MMQKIEFYIHSEQLYIAILIIIQKYVSKDHKELLNIT
jgi:hypothetical protein